MDAHAKRSQSSTTSTLPAELIDHIIDFLWTDKTTLGVCGQVNQSWLPRTRYHIFSKLEIKNSRLTALSHLLRSSRCTFRSTVRTLRLDNSEYLDYLNLHDEPPPFDTDTVTTQFPGHHSGHASASCPIAKDQQFLLDAAALFPLLLSVQVLQFGCIDWTSIPPPSQAAIIRRLSQLSQIRRVEFEGTMFHDLRDLLKILSIFPSLGELKVNIAFSKVRPEAVRGALHLHLPKGLKVIEIESGDGAAVLLSCLALRAEEAVFASEDQKRQHEVGLESLRLNHITFSELTYVQNTLHTLGPSLRHLVLGFVASSRPAQGYVDRFKTPDCSSPPHASTFGTLLVENAHLAHASLTPLILDTLSPSVPETISLIPLYLSQLSSAHIQSVEIHIRNNPANSLPHPPLITAPPSLSRPGTLNWKELQTTLLETGRFPKLRNVTIVIAPALTTATNSNSFPTTNTRGALISGNVNYIAPTDITSIGTVREIIKNSMPTLAVNQMLHVIHVCETC